MNTDYILKVTGNILLNTKGVEPRSLSMLTEETDLYLDLGLSIHQVKRVIISLTERFKINLTQDAFQHSNMKYWIDFIMNALNFKSSRRIVF